MPAGMPSKGENINHFNGVRLRILGNGIVRMKLMSLPDVSNIKIERNLPDLNLDILQQQREPLKKVNFTTQRTQLEITTTQIGEVIKINRIIIFAKPVATNYPG